MKGILWFVLTSASRQQLLEVVPPCFDKTYAHHVTLFYDTELAPDKEQLIGQSYQIKVTHEAWNDNIQAVPVEIELETQNKVAHITISTTLGIPPVASNEMLGADHEERQLSQPLILEGVVAFKSFKDSDSPHSS